MEPAPRHLPLHYDGIRVDRERVQADGSTDVMCKNSTAAIFAGTGYKVTVVEKHHHFCLELLRVREAEGSRQSEAIDPLLQDGNCIPMSIARV